MTKKAWDKIKQKIKNLLLINDTPHKIAGGFALGIFLGILPGEGVTASLVVASVLRLNLAAAAAGALAFNLWSSVVFLPMAAFIGGSLFGDSPARLMELFRQADHFGLKTFLSKALLFDLTVPLLAGFAVLALAVSLPAYAALFYALKYKKVEMPHQQKEVK